MQNLKKACQESNWSTAITDNEIKIKPNMKQKQVKKKHINYYK